MSAVAPPEEAILDPVRRPVVAPPEVARVLNVSEKTLRRLWEAGKFLRPFKVGSQLRWRTSDVLAWLESAQ